MLVTATLASAQITSKTAGEIKKINLFINPFSVFEPHQAAVGAGIAYRHSDRWEPAVELNYLFKGSLSEKKFNGLSGLRATGMIKYFVGQRKLFFIGFDLRYKHYSYNDSTNFIRRAPVDTLKNVHSATTMDVYGIGFIYGKQFLLSANGKLKLELMLGIGAKQRNAGWKAKPEGYTTYIEKGSGGSGIAPHYGYSEGNVYFPGAVRIFYQL